MKKRISPVCVVKGFSKEAWVNGYIVSPQGDVEYGSAQPHRLEGYKKVFVEDDGTTRLVPPSWRIHVIKRDPGTYLTRLRDAAFERYMISNSKADEEAWLDLEGRIRGYVRQTNPERIEQMKAERHAFNMAMDKEVNKLVSEPLAKAGWIYNMGKGNQPIGDEVLIDVRTGAFDPGKTMMAKDVDWGQRFLWRVAKATHHGDENVTMQPAVSLEDWCVKHKDEITKRTETPQGDGSIADAMLRDYKL